MNQSLFEQIRPHRDAIGAARPHARTTLDFAGLDDHVRLPARFFGRMTATDSAGLASAIG